MSNILIYQDKDGFTKIDVRLENETLWITQQQMADLFQTTKQNVSLHINNIYKEGELQESATVKDFLTVQHEGKRSVKRSLQYYNLDMIISVGYRIKSIVATHFRIWATQVIKEFLIKGFALDDERLKEARNNYFDELLERIRDIRTSEKLFYRKICDIFATSIDYDHLADAVIAKNYLNEKELRSLGQIVSGYLDFAERQAEREETMTMEDWAKHLDRILTVSGEKLLQGAGLISHEQAISKAENEYKKYQAKTLSDVEKAYLESIKDVQKIVDNKE